MTDAMRVATEEFCGFPILPKCEKNLSTGESAGSSVGRDRPEKQVPHIK